MFDSFFSLVLLLLGTALGWVLARRSSATSRPGAEHLPTPEQMGGLITDLAGDDPDRALATLTRAAEMDHSMAELHLTLGSLFRKRGQVDRALRVHETLLARPELKPEIREQGSYELAQDYLKAGLIDRAEKLLAELSVRGTYVASALKLLQSVHEQSRDWVKAIEAARRLESAQGESQKLVISQYFCELADEALQQRQPGEALKLARQALDEHAGCVRACLLIGKMQEAADDFPAAIKAYRRVLDQDARFLPEVLEPLRRCYAKTGEPAQFSEFLADAKEMATHSSLPWLSEAQLLRAAGGDAMGHLAQGLEQRPSRAVLAEFLLEMESRPEVIAAGLGKAAASLRGTLKHLAERAPPYQCGHCGFQPRQLFWQCPGCRQWASVTPMDDVLGNSR